MCGHAFSASTISQIGKGLDESPARFANRQFEEDHPYLILEARHEKVRGDAVLQSQAVRVAVASG